MRWCEQYPSRERRELWVTAAEGQDIKLIVHSRLMPVRRGHLILGVLHGGQLIGLRNLTTGEQVNFVRSDPPLLFRRCDGVGLALFVAASLMAGGGRDGPWSTPSPRCWPCSMRDGSGGACSPETWRVPSTRRSGRPWRIMACAGCEVGPSTAAAPGWPLEALGDTLVAFGTACRALGLVSMYAVRAVYIRIAGTGTARRAGLPPVCRLLIDLYRSFDKLSVYRYFEIK
jgi:hypothetical protein